MLWNLVLLNRRGLISLNKIKNTNHHHIRFKFTYLKNPIYERSDFNRHNVLNYPFWHRRPEDGCPMHAAPQGWTHTITPSHRWQTFFTGGLLTDASLIRHHVRTICSARNKRGNSVKPFLLQKIFIPNSDHTGGGAKIIIARLTNCRKAYVSLEQFDTIFTAFPRTGRICIYAGRAYANIFLTLFTYPTGKGNTGCAF